MPDTTTNAHGFRRTPQKTAAAIMELLTDEFEQLAALASALVDRLKPPHVPGEECTDVYSWRLAQMIEERLESDETMKLVEQTLAELQ